MAILRLGRFLPRSIREWDAIFRSLNEAVDEDENGNITVTADNLPPQDAAYLTLSNNASLTADRVLTPVAGELVGADGGPVTTYTLGLADAGTAGEYPVVTTDAKGRVTSGRVLAETDIPAEIQRVPDELAAASSVAESDTVIVSQSGTTRAATVDQLADAVFGDDWDDLVIPGVAVNPTGLATPPSLNGNTGLLEFSASADNVCIFVWQLPHGWSGAWDASLAIVVPHLHVRNLTASTAVSRWSFEYDAASVNGDFANAYESWTTLGTVSHTNPNNTAGHRIISFGNLDLAGKGISTVLHGRVSRLAATDGADLDASVVALYSADLHIRRRRWGTESEYTSP